jgi:hypothetical protein
VAERDDDERRAENEEAITNAAGAILGSLAGPGGSAAGAWLGPALLRLVRGVWAELSDCALRRYLIDEQFMSRTAAGLYWRAAPSASFLPVRVRPTAPGARLPLISYVARHIRHQSDPDRNSMI